MTYTTKTVNNAEVTHLDKLYGKVVSVGVTYFRNLSLSIQNMGFWQDTSSSGGWTPVDGQWYYSGVASPAIGTLYSATNAYSHYLTTGLGTGYVAGIVGLEYSHSSETGWSSDQTAIKRGSLG